MGKLHSEGSWLIRAQGNEHPPVHVHVHVIHPDGKAVVHLDGTVLNRGVPTAVIAQAVAWVTGHAAAIRSEWDRMNNPPAR